MKKIHQITENGKKELELELEELKSQRSAVATKIAEARDFGDLSENAEYDSARESQGLIESRIAEIEAILLNASIIKSSKKSTVSLGSIVDLVINQDVVTYTVVGPVEANPIEGKVSNESPVGQALMGKKVGDDVTITTPKTSVSYKISSIR